jgi:seryl-tRNA(Sec) selenium transferase
MQTEGVGVVIDFSNGRRGHGRHDGDSVGIVHPHPRQAVNAVRTLRRALGRFDLSDPEAAEAFQLLAEIEVELRACEPNRAAVASRLERLVELLSDAGPADLGVVRSTRAIATWVGPMGAALVERLG